MLNSLKSVSLKTSNVMYSGSEPSGSFPPEPSNKPVDAVLDLPYGSSNVIFLPPSK